MCFVVCNSFPHEFESTMPNQPPLVPNLTLDFEWVICWKANNPNKSTSFVVPLAVAVKSLPKTKRIIRLIHFNIPRNETCVLAKAVRF